MPNSLDPQNIQGESDLLVSFNIFEGLTSLSTTGEPRPACAENWTLSPDKMTYTFTLREGLLWENGASMEGSDFVYGLQRFLSSELIGMIALQGHEEI